MRKFLSSRVNEIFGSLLSSLIFSIFFYASYEVLSNHLPKDIISLSFSIVVYILEFLIFLAVLGYIWE